MSLTPTPDFSQIETTVKGFWQRSEGKFGKKVLLAGGGGLLLLGFLFRDVIQNFYQFIMTLAQDGFWLAVILAAGFVLTSPIWCSPVRMWFWNAFQMVIGWSYEALIRKDPIRILRNNVLLIQKEGEVADEGIKGLAGSKERLESDISEQMRTINTNRNRASAAAKEIEEFMSQLANAKGNEKQELLLAIERNKLAIQGCREAAAFSLDTIRQEQPILVQTNASYERMCRIRDLADFRVKSLSQKADMYEKRRATIMSSQKALGAVGRMLKPNPQQLALVNQTVDYLNKEASDTIGAMNDFNRWSQKYLAEMDIQNDAAAEEATHVFAQIEAKLALPGATVASATQAAVHNATADVSSLMDDFPEIGSSPAAPALASKSKA